MSTTFALHSAPVSPIMNWLSYLPSPSKQQRVVRQAVPRCSTRWRSMLDAQENHLGSEFRYIEPRRHPRTTITESLRVEANDDGLFRITAS